MVIKVEQRHIDAASPGPFSCPVTLALQEMTGTKVWAGSGVAYIPDNGLNHKWIEFNANLPNGESLKLKDGTIFERKIDVIWNYDQTGEFKPCEIPVLDQTWWQRYHPEFGSGDITPKELTRLAMEYGERIGLGDAVVYGEPKLKEDVWTVKFGLKYRKCTIGVFRCYENGQAIPELCSTFQQVKTHCKELPTSWPCKCCGMPHEHDKKRSEMCNCGSVGLCGNCHKCSTHCICLDGSKYVLGYSGKVEFDPIPDGWV